MPEKLIFAVPSKGRLRESALSLLASCGLGIAGTGHERGYRGRIEELPDVDVAYVPASEIAAKLRTGDAHLGITGEDLVREDIPDAATRVVFLKKLGFGPADVVVAVPACWIDVHTMADLESVAHDFRAAHGSRICVATKYVKLTRGFFARHGVTDYRIAESFGATEGAPAAGAADLIVDITTTGETLRANGLRVLDDGVILRSEANLVLSRAAPWTDELSAVQEEILARLSRVLG